MCLCEMILSNLYFFLFLFRFFFFKTLALSQCSKFYLGCSFPHSFSSFTHKVDPIFLPTTQPSPDSVTRVIMFLSLKCNSSFLLPREGQGNIALVHFLTTIFILSCRVLLYLRSKCHHSSPPPLPPQPFPFFTPTITPHHRILQPLPCFFSDLVLRMVEREKER